MFNSSIRIAYYNLARKKSRVLRFVQPHAASGASSKTLTVRCEDRLCGLCVWKFGEIQFWPTQPLAKNSLEFGFGKSGDDRSFCYFCPFNQIDSCNHLQHSFDRSLDTCILKTHKFLDNLQILKLFGDLIRK